jgi:septal ring factor EnvC (AmiA/AmiB activator)
MISRADQLQHSDMVGVRQSLGSLDKRVSVLEVKQGNTDTHLQDLRTEVQEVSREVRALGDKLIESQQQLREVFSAHVNQENEDRLKLIRGQKQTITTVILAIAALSAPYIVEYLRFPILP